MPDCYRIDLIDLVLGVVLGRIIVLFIEATWEAWRERHIDGNVCGSSGTEAGR